MIETTNLRLVPCELAHFEAILNDVEILEQMLGVTVTEGWLQFPETIQFGYDYLKANPEALGWWTYLFIHTKDQVLIGNGGFAGLPDASGVVEIGYAIAPAYRNRAAIYHEFQKLVVEAAPLVWVHELQFVTVYNKQFKDLIVSPLGLYASFDRAYQDR